MDIIHFPRCHRCTYKIPHSYPYPSREGITIRRPSPRASHNGSSRPVICKRKWSMFWYHSPLGRTKWLKRSEGIQSYSDMPCDCYHRAGQQQPYVFDAGLKMNREYSEARGIEVPKASFFLTDRGSEDSIVGTSPIDWDRLWTVNFNISIALSHMDYFGPLETSSPDDGWIAMYQSMRTRNINHLAILLEPWHKHAAIPLNLSRGHFIHRCL